MQRFLPINGLPPPVIAIELGDLAPPGSTGFYRAWAIELYSALLDQSRGSLILLDSQAPRLAHARVRHARHEWGLTSKQELAELAANSQLLVSFARASRLSTMVAIPVLRVWPPDTVEVEAPGPRTLNAVCGEQRSTWTARRWEYNLIEYLPNGPSVAEIAETAANMLAGAEFGLPTDARAKSAQLKHYLKWCRQTTPFADYADRQLTFERLFREIGRRFTEPTIVETGCVRAWEDWSAGYSTYLFGAYLTALQAGCLHTVDCNSANLKQAEAITASFSGCTSFHLSDSAEWLANFPGQIDVLYLDSMDVGVAGYEDHALAEAQAAEVKLHAQSLILIDDTVWDRGWTGKGAKAVPWLMSRGWRILLAGYQVLLSR